MELEEPQIRSEPKPRFPEQHQPAPGEEAQLKPRPRYEARRYRAAGKLEGKAALITGGDSGIGRAVAVLFAREGADVAISYLPEEQRDAEDTARAVQADGRSTDLRSRLQETHASQRVLGQIVEGRARPSSGR